MPDMFGVNVKWSASIRYFSAKLDFEHALRILQVYEWVCVWRAWKYRCTRKVSEP